MFLLVHRFFIGFGALLISFLFLLVHDLFRVDRALLLGLLGFLILLGLLCSLGHLGIGFFIIGLFSSFLTLLGLVLGVLFESLGLRRLVGLWLRWLQHVVHLLEVEISLALGSLLPEQLSHGLGELESLNLLVFLINIGGFISGSLQVGIKHLFRADGVLMLRLDELPDGGRHGPFSIVQGENGVDNDVFVLSLGGFRGWFGSGGHFVLDNLK